MVRLRKAIQSAKGVAMVIDRELVKRLEVKKVDVKNQLSLEAKYKKQIDDRMKVLQGSVKKVRR